MLFRSQSDLAFIDVLFSWHLYLGLRFVNGGFIVNDPSGHCLFYPDAKTRDQRNDAGRDQVICGMKMGRREKKNAREREPVNMV